MTHDHGRIEKWRGWQVAEGRSIRTITERCDRVYDFARTVGCDPVRANVDDVLAFLSQIRGRERFGQPIQPSSVATYFGQLRAWFTWLVLTDQRDDNPTDRIKRPRWPKGKPRPVSPAEFHAVYAVRMHRRTRGMMWLATFEGLRASEVARFHGRQVNHVAGELRVRGKGDEIKVLPLHPVIARMALTYPKDDFWFPSTSTSGRLHVSGNSVSETIGEVFKRAGVDGGAHRLRHWYGSELVAKDVNLRVVQELMRHASLQSTQIYTQVTIEQQRGGIVQLMPPDKVGSQAA